LLKALKGVLEEKFGFDQLVQTSTHGNNILDKVFTNRPDLFQTTVHQSLLKTKHLAVTVHCGCYDASGQRVSKRENTFIRPSGKQY